MIRIRPAEAADVAVVRDIILETLLKDPFWRALFPLGWQHDGQYIQSIETILAQYLDPDNSDWHIVVVELHEREVVSVAVWDMTIATDGHKQIPDISTILPSPVDAAVGIQTNNLSVLASAIFRGRTTFFGAKSPYRQHKCLQILVTRPAHQKRGYAKALCSLAVEDSRKDGIPAVVMANPKAYILFSDLRFADVGHLPLPVESVGGVVALKAMLFDPASEPKRSSIVDSLFQYFSQ